MVERYPLPSSAGFAVGPNHRRTVSSTTKRSVDPVITRTTARMADGRELIYFDETPDAPRVLVDERDLPAVIHGSQVRYDAITGEWVGIAGHRQTRTYHPPANACPLCPSTPLNASEIPSPDYDVVVFENRFPSFSGTGPVAQDGTLFDARDGNGRCEVVSFTSDHNATLSTLPVSGCKPSSPPGPTAPRRCPRAPASSRCSVSRTAAWRSA